MGDEKGFIKLRRQYPEYRPVCERTKDYAEVAVARSDERSKEQASRCMDCGTPFCHWACPVFNIIPEWNDLVYQGRWEQAWQLMDATNNFPEFTGRLCPALCEYSCVLGINDDPVTIRENELAIIEHAFKDGTIKPRPPKNRSGKKVAVIGSGPAGLACADQLNRAGHSVTVFEKDNKPGGILRYGIPDFKIEKSIIDRRLRILEQEGIEFKTSVNAGLDIKAKQLLNDYDAVCLAGGSRVPRDLPIEGRSLEGIHFAMDYLIQSNKMLSGEITASSPLFNKEGQGGVKNFIISAKGKKTVVIGGGDTGADCVGTAHRQGAACVVQIELMPKPPDCRTCDYPWPNYPFLLKTSSSHEEGGERRWSLLTKKFIGQNNKVKKISCINVDFSRKDKEGRSSMQEVPGSEFDIDADLVILAMGFVHPEKSVLLDDLGVKFDKRNNVRTDSNFMTDVNGVFSCGDMRRGQSLVVWAISEGRLCANHVNKFLSPA